MYIYICMCIYIYIYTYIYRYRYRYRRNVKEHTSIKSIYICKNLFHNIPFSAFMILRFFFQ